MIGVLVAEDHSVVRAGLVGLLESAEDIEVIATATDGAEAVDRAAELAPDVILMDLSMPELGGLEATRRIHERDPEARIVVLTSFSDRERILEAIDAGAIGYLLKDAEPDELFRGIRAAAAGESPLAPKVARTMIGERARGGTTAELSDREREVLALLAEGMANKQIARRLEISEKTVKSHLTNIYRQIDVDSRTEAAIWARDHGMGAGGE